MTNLQFYISLGVPVMLILIGMLSNHSRFNRLESQLGDIGRDVKADIRILNSIALEHAQRLTKLEK